MLPDAGRHAACGATESGPGVPNGGIRVPDAGDGLGASPAGARPPARAATPADLIGRKLWRPPLRYKRGAVPRGRRCRFPPPPAATEDSAWTST